MTDSLIPGTSTITFPELRYPTPQLSSSFLSDASSPESVREDSIDPVEEEQDLSHVELTDHLNKLFLEDKRFFGQAR